MPERPGNPTITIGRFMVSTVHQSGGHPWIDQCCVGEAKRHRKYKWKRTWTGWVIRPSLRRQRDRSGGTALVIAWEKHPTPWENGR